MWYSTYAVGEKYLQQYPKMAKWINQCGGCQAKGYRPDMPTNNSEFKNIRYRFDCLPLNEVGLCEVCSNS